MPKKLENWKKLPFEYDFEFSTMIVRELFKNFRNFKLAVLYTSKEQYIMEMAENCIFVYGFGFKQ